MNIENNVDFKKTFHDSQMMNKEITQGESFAPEINIDVHEVNSNDYIKKFESTAADKPLYKDNPERMRLIQKQVEPALKNVVGFKPVLEKTLSKNPDSARGFFAELINAQRAHNAKLEVLEMDKTAYSEAGDKTDIDLYVKTQGGKTIVIENKDCRTGISLTKDFKRKIDLMSKDLYDKNGNIIPKDASLFINNGPITANAKQYALERNVHIKDNMDGRVRQRYYGNLAKNLDSK